MAFRSPKRPKVLKDKDQKYLKKIRKIPAKFKWNLGVVVSFCRSIDWFSYYSILLYLLDLDYTSWMKIIVFLIHLSIMIALVKLIRKDVRVGISNFQQGMGSFLVKTKINFQPPSEMYLIFFQPPFPFDHPPTADSYK